jgi:poly(3-hydroxybutyrate) depolymerase
MVRIEAVVVALLALAPATARAAWETKSIAGMDSRVYTPASASKIGEGHGLLVVLHGCSQTADQLQQYGNFEPAADEFGWVVAIPNVPGGGVYAGCWDYYGPDHTRTTRHDGPLIDLTETMRDDPAYDIDPAQIYISGVSSGGGQAAVSGCLAPELFAGIGIVAGPAVGTTINDIATVASTGSQAAEVCRQLAGSNSAQLASQLAIAFTDSSDYVVAQGYAEVHAEMYGELIAGDFASMTESMLDVASLPGASPSGVGSVYSDGVGDRVMWLKTDGNGHAWPAGSGESGGGALSFVSGTGVNFSYLMAEFFTANSVRADGTWDPSDSGGSDTDSGDGSSSDGSDSGGSDTGAGSSSGADGGSSGASSVGDTEGGAGADGPIEPSGCQCRSRPVGQNPTCAWLVLVGFLGSRMRRRPANV